MSVGAVNKSTGDRIPTAGMPAIDAALSGSSTNPVQNMVVKAAFDAVKDGQSIDSFADVETALGEKADTDIVASDFSTAVSYTAGNYCIYEGKFYKFKNNHSGAWAAADVDEIKIAGELSSLMSGLNKIKKISITAPSNLSSTAIGADVAIPIDAGYNGWLVIGVYLYAYGQNRGILECFSISTIVNNTITLLSLNKELASGYDSAAGFAIVVDPS